MNGPIARVVVATLAVALTAVLHAGCGTTLMLPPSSSRTWEIVERRAMFDMDCDDLHSRTTLGNGAARTNALGRKYYEFAVRGCGRRAVYRAYFRAFPFNVGYMGASDSAERPEQQEVDRMHAAEEWTQEVELVGLIRDDETPAHTTPPPAAEVPPPQP